MMFDGIGSTEVQDALVFTSENRGHSPEEMAEMAMNKIMSVSESAPPAIKAQALAHREMLKQVLIFYMEKMAQSERTTIWAKLRQQGHEDMAEIIRRL